MPDRTIIASLGGLVAGVALTITAVADTSTDGDDGTLLASAMRLIPLVCVTLVALAVFRRWITCQENRTRRDLADLDEQRRRLTDEIARQAAELDAREDRLNRSAESRHARLNSLAQRLDDALTYAKEQRRLNQTLQAECDELAADHNRLVQQVMQERADVFAHRANHVRAASPGGTATGITQPVRLRTRGASSVAGPQHEHGCTGEGVGDAL